MSPPRDDGPGGVPVQPDDVCVPGMPGFGLPGLGSVRPADTISYEPEPWVVSLLPGGSFDVECPDRPNLWVRLWQRLLLGWRWRRNTRERFSIPGRPTSG